MTIWKIILIQKTKYIIHYTNKKCEKMKINGSLTLKYKTDKSASLIYNSLEVDNENYVKGDLNNDTINYEINSKSLGSFLATIDDLIASEIVSEKIIGKTKELWKVLYK